MFFVLGISVAVFLMVLLLLKKRKSLADRVLGLWLLLLVVHQSLFFFDYSNVVETYPHIIGLELPLPILEGIFLFFYTQALTRKKLPIATVVLHCIPVILLYLLAIPFYILGPEEKMVVRAQEGLGFEWYMYILTIWMAISGFGYTIVTFLLIKSHAKRIRNAFSNIENKELRWLKYMCVFMGVIWLVASFPTTGAFIFSVVVLFVLFIGFFGINQMDIFSTKETLVEFQEKAESDKSLRYAKSGLKMEQANSIGKALTRLMANEKPYKKSNLPITEVARHLQIHPNHLSQVINEKEEKNYYTYINQLRVEEFVRIAVLPENRQYTILSLAYECGFNSKSTFNKHFKGRMGCTPKEYLDSNL